jgi:hypothetical protein
MMQFFTSHIDWISIKLTLGSLVLAFLTGSGIALFLACLASLSTIAYNIYRFKKDLKNKK